MAAGCASPPPPAPPPRPEAPAAPPLPDDVAAAIQGRLSAKVYPGLMLGVLERGTQHYYAFGSTSLSAQQTPDEHTIYEIGSVSELFSSLLLADMLQKKQAELAAPASRYLQAGVAVPSYHGEPITLEQLAEHTSGLPRLPSNLAPAEPQNPYADYGYDRLFDFLANHELTRPPGQSFEYSFVGAALLGRVLERAAHFAYEELFVSRIASVLGLDETRITLTPLMASRLAQGSRGGAPAGSWDLAAFAPAAGLKSSAFDLLGFLSVAMGLRESPLGAPLLATEQPRAAAGPGAHVGFGWQIRSAPGGDVIWHGGGTGGYHAFIGFSPKRALGVVLLTNSGSSADDIGLHLLDARLPLEEPRPELTEPALASLE